MQRLTDDPLLVTEGGVVKVAFSADGKTVAAAYSTASGDYGVVLWDLFTRKRTGDDPLHVTEGKVSCVAFSPDITILAIGSRTPMSTFGLAKGSIVLWEVSTRKRLVEVPLTVTEGNVESVAFGPDGKTLAVGYASTLPNRNCGVLLWDVTTRSRLVNDPLPMEEGYVARLKFSSDGTTLLAQNNRFAYQGKGTGLTLWNVDLKSWHRIAGRIANRNLTRDEWRQYFHAESYRRTFLDLPDGRGITEARQDREPRHFTASQKAGTDKASL